MLPADFSPPYIRVGALAERFCLGCSDGELYQLPTDLSGVGLSPAAVAQQLTHIELQHLSFIGTLSYNILYSIFVSKVANRLL
jgi:hypothetical protein